MHHGKTSMDDIFVRKYRRKIECKTVLSSNSSCMLWTGCCKKSYRLTQYGVICVKFPASGGNAGKWKTVLVHRLMYMLHHNLKKIPKHLSCSHICNVSLCVNPQHITLERLFVNNNRRQCAREQHCFGHGHYPQCI